MFKNFRNGVITLMNVPELDVNYSNTFSFSDINNQRTYFNKKAVNTIGNCSFIRGDEFIKVPYNKDSLINVNYLKYNNGEKDYYCFVLSIEYVNDGLSHLYIKLDVFQTYMFNVSLLPSLVERAHVNRWNGNTPIINQIGEPIEIPELEITEKKSLYHYEDSYVICASVPLGVVNGTGDNMNEGIIDGGGTEGGGDVFKGIPSVNLFLMLKGYEGFAPNPYYADSTNNIAYGITEKNWFDIYNLCKPFPVSEEIGSIMTSRILIDGFGKPLMNAFKSDGVNVDEMLINQFDAFVDLAYNAGQGAVLTSPMYSMFKQDPNNPQIETEWKKWYIKNEFGVIMPGLVARREAEWNIYKNSQYDIRKISIIDSNGIPIGTMLDNNGKGYIPDDFNNVDNPNNLKYVNNEKGNNWLFPTHGTITSDYGARRDPITGNQSFHTGIDVGAPLGTPIYSSKAGTVTKKQEITSGYGHALYIDHGNGVVGIYAHCSLLLKNVGDVLKAGEHIANMGSTGNSTGSHLHWELRYNNNDFDPANGINKGDVV